MVPAALWTLLPCYTSSDFDPDPREYIQRHSCLFHNDLASRLHAEYEAHGTDAFGIDFTECDPDGSYNAVQCEIEQCRCVNPGGAGMGAVGDAALKDAMTCNCARDSPTLEDLGLTPPACELNGNYGPIQQAGDNLYCADQDGFQTSPAYPADYRCCLANWGCEANTCSPATQLECEGHAAVIDVQPPNPK